MKLRKAKDFNFSDVEVEKYIEESLYEKQFDQEIYPGVLYVNDIDMNELDPQSIKKKLQELGFRVTFDKKGLDNVMIVKTK